MALIRYPGSKKKLAGEIIAEFPPEASLPLWMDSGGWEYREPFFGAGAVGFAILERLPPACSAWINDIDWGIVCLWRVVHSDVKRLCQKIEGFVPSVDAFYQFKREDGRRDLPPLEVGFRKFALHQMSYSGFGAVSGGPLGGAEQEETDPYTVACRWNPERAAEEALQLHKVLEVIPRLKITCGDFAELIDDNPDVFLYLDPPYYKRGPVLYRYFMTHEDHVRLAERLRLTFNRWVLSYDDHPVIRELYSWAEFKELYITYTAGLAVQERRPKNQEVLIMPRTS
jgi:DNA adenine methylase